MPKEEILLGNCTAPDHPFALHLPTHLHSTLSAHLVRPDRQKSDISSRSSGGVIEPLLLVAEDTDWREAILSDVRGRA